MSELPTAGDAAQAAWEAEQKLAQLNALRAEAKAEKDRTRHVLELVMEEQKLHDAGSAPREDGKRTLYYFVDKPHFNIVNREQVMEWAAGEDETYIDPEPSLRENLVFQECRRRREEGIALPPGISVYADKELHKRTI